MSGIQNKNRYFMIGLILAVLSGMILFGSTQAVHAERRGSGHREFMDSGYGHNHAYPERGQYVGRLPRGSRGVFYGRTRYYSYGGIWYRPYRSRFAIVAPPFGMIVPFLPPNYVSLWVGGFPYYYANEVYYTQAAGGYIVAKPPEGEVSQEPPSEDKISSDQLFIYPRQGQSEKKQATDRYECHSWAVSQTGYDPTKPPVGAPLDQMRQKRADYQRAMSACLDGRGYTVK